MKTTNRRVFGFLSLVACFLGSTGEGHSALISLDGPWLLATDPHNQGRQEKWWTSPQPQAKTTKVPWIIQDAFPGYHGVAWYWKDFDPPAKLNEHGRTLLRFWQVDYKADVWLNDVNIGSHEGGESPFVLDVTDVVKPGQTNRLAVRVLNPTHQPIDGIVLNETPHRNKALPYTSGNAWDQGGICDSVELLTVPALRVEDLFVRPDWLSGLVHIRANIRNAGTGPARANVLLSIAPAAVGETLVMQNHDIEFNVGDSLVETTLRVDQVHRWNLDDPFLYRLTARIASVPSPPTQTQPDVHEHSVRFGFRDFRFDRGAFRLNGKRIYLRGSHTGNCCPIGLEMPHDPDYLRRDLINQKMMRFNAIRFISGMAKRYQLDLADEIGLLVYEECYAGWLLADSPRMKERYNESVFGMIKRDRNHPSVAIWGLLNETGAGPVFRHAVSVLPEVRKLDDTRVVLLNSGRFDNATGPGVEAWHQNDRPDPCITRNAADHVVQMLGITWQPGQVAFHPGPGGEFAVVRWTAPAAERLTFGAQFKSIAEHATTDLHVLHNGKPLWTSMINLEGKGPEARFAAQIDVKPGDMIDSICGWGNRNYGADTTALNVNVRSPSGKTWDLVRDFSPETNPNGDWSFGWLRPTPRPDSSSFTLFPLAVSGKAIGSISNPGEVVWQDNLSDLHPYQRVPHTDEIIHKLRTLDGNGKPVWLSEYGIGSAIDLLRVVRWYEQVGKPEVEDARLYRSWRDQFNADWARYRLADVFGRPEDFFTQSIARMGGQRLLGINAIRSNPHVIGHSLTGTLDQGMTAEGVWTTFRELKPGATDALFDAWAPLRFCLFAEPLNLYRRTPVHLEAVLANEDVLRPGDYPVRLQVIGPDLTRVFEKTIRVTIPEASSQSEPPMVMPIFTGDVMIDGPPGTYRFLATFEQGAAACGEETRFFADVESAKMPRVDTEILVVGNDAELAAWLTGHGIRNRPYNPAEPQKAREVILASGKPTGDPEIVFPDLARRIARGSNVVFLTTDTLARGSDTTGWLPLKSKGRVSGIARWLYHADEWARRHPIFDGLPTGGVLDYSHYRELIGDTVFMDIQPPAEPVAGGINASWGYQSGLIVGVYKLEAGRFIVNTLLIRQNLGRIPQAERLLRNMLRYAAVDLGSPLAELPADFPARLKEVGY